MDVTAFINSERIPYPQLLSNTVYFGDRVFLKNGDLVLNTPFSVLQQPDELLKPINFKTGIGGTVLVISYPSPYNPTIIENTNLLYKYEMVLRVKNSSYIMRSMGDGSVVWILRGNTEISPDDKLYLYPLKSVDDRPRYGEQFYISIGRKGILGVKDGELSEFEKDKNIEDIKVDDVDASVVFEFVPQVNVYYCDGDSCVDIPLSRTKDGKIDGKDTYRRSDCYNTCGYKGVKKSKSDVILFVVTIVILVILIILLSRR